ncbi:hypothetical protein COX22_04930 [Candidatus Falkowbacteria bacterium CG23_combo_of_CG06-09_8_20_14_all_49_15]|uniref:Glycosyl transferase family 1 domain-containing protein n=1 Tax=Candidatus Falkowbacteria bacterium CG23_combo_of_CG06-09_8_20_14_all_49_15 TaxID=1974572 RepID=A0A2G9ZLW2_9BACT|nr:MAG: hypothetical protein COX22_04930 [Candidatus Falkowbacteria bacterium CG23_combo_of_CG06-09_8_20_14_all_49_15]
MPNNLLLINSAPETDCFFNDLSAAILSAQEVKFTLGGKKTGTQKKLRLFGPGLVPDPDSGKIPARQKLLFWLCLPANLLALAWQIFFFRWRYPIKNILAWQLREKILLGLLGRTLRLSTTWCLHPDWPENGLGRVEKRLIISLSQKVKMIYFTEETANKALTFGYPDKNLCSAPFAADGGRELSQQTIFNSLAQGEKTLERKKFFTIGLAPLSPRLEKTDVLFQAVALCQAMIARCQIIVAGDGGEGKTRRQWLAKKIGLESLVWFVGETGRRRKWLPGFDLYFPLSPAPGFNDLHWTAAALLAGAPALAVENSGFNSLIKPGLTGWLVKSARAEELAQAIKQAAADRRRRPEISRQTAQAAREIFALEKSAAEVKNICATPIKL